jgi:tetratricopeptide (TPR) repeat protein
VSHFERAFYELTPQKRDREAAQEFDQAIAQFELELSREPSSAVAHQYLGRIYSLRKDYRKSAVHYDRLSEIEPLNVDACVLAALAYGEAGDFAEAKVRLVEARQRTSDPAALARIAEYLDKVDKLIR